LAIYSRTSSSLLLGLIIELNNVCVCADTPARAVNRITMQKYEVSSAGQGKYKLYKCLYKQYKWNTNEIQMECKWNANEIQIGYKVVRL